MRRSRRPGGFSLIEVALASAIIGIGIVALVASLGAASRVNDAGRDLTKAIFLADEIREWTVQLPFKDPDAADANNPPGPDGTDPQVFVDDLDDLYNAAGLVFSPPRDGTGVAIANMTGWSEKLTLTWRDPNNFTQTVSPGTSTVINVAASIRLRGKEIMATSWLVAKRN
jgi:prepilin-type N-terminal cleavage/methylation domain-containing protein